VVTLIDTSAWIEYLRQTGSKTHVALRSMIEENLDLATTDVVIMELLAGVNSSATRQKIWGLMNRCVMLPTRPLFDYEVAAELYSRCRANGFTLANTNDVLIAAVAIGKKVPLLAADTDFERIAAVSTLNLAA
jgi:predicted nucleic acid-binding protein